MLTFIKYVNNKRYGSALLVLLFFGCPLFLNSALNHFKLSQSLSYSSQDISFDSFEITPPSRVRGIILYKNNKRKEMISLSNRVSASDIAPYRNYSGVASYMEMDTGGSEPRKGLLQIQFNGVSKKFGNLEDLPDKKERIASARKQVGYAILMFTIGIIWLLYVLYQFLNNQDMENSRIEQTN